MKQPSMYVATSIEFTIYQSHLQEKLITTMQILFIGVFPKWLVGHQPTFQNECQFSHSKYILINKSLLMNILTKQFILTS